MDDWNVSESTELTEKWHTNFVIIFIVSLCKLVHILLGTYDLHKIISDNLWVFRTYIYTASNIDYFLVQYTKM